MHYSDYWIWIHPQKLKPVIQIEQKHTHKNYDFYHAASRLWNGHVLSNSPLTLTEVASQPGDVGVSGSQHDGYWASLLTPICAPLFSPLQPLASSWLWHRLGLSLPVTSLGLWSLPQPLARRHARPYTATLSLNVTRLVCWRGATMRTLLEFNKKLWSLLHVHFTNITTN